MKGITKSSLAILLSKLKGFAQPSAKAEQYTTDSETAATVLWDAYMNGDIKGKAIADLGCGTGILGIGCLVLGAKKVYFLDQDANAITLATQNIKSVERQLETSLKRRCIFTFEDISSFKEKADTVIQNPPFGTKNKGNDLKFLDKALETAPVVYSFHKASTLDYLKKYVAKQGFSVVHAMLFHYPLHQTMRFHRKRIERIAVVCLHIAKSR